MAPNQDSRNAKNVSWSEPQVNYALRVVGLFLVALLAVFVFVKIINEVKTYNTIGEVPQSPYVITVSGQGEVTAKKDTAVLSFTSSGKGATAAEAQAKAAELNNKAMDFLRSKGIEEKNISTNSYNTYPTYTEKIKPCIVDRTAPTGMEIMPVTTPCNSYEQVITGYETTQVVEIKLREIDKNPALSSEIITGLGTAGVRVGNLMNTIDKPEELESQARQIAIADARAEATQIARSLGARLGKVVSFDQGGTMYPMYEMRDAGMSAKAQAAPVPNPEIPTGEGKITSNVNVTFEIIQ